VKPKGHIVGGNEEKNAWDDTIRTLIPKIFYISAIEWDHHKPESLDKLRASFDANFEYVGNRAFGGGLQKCCEKVVENIKM